MKQASFAVIVLVSSIGCGVCLYQPLHGDGALFFTPDLLGEWKRDGENRIWRFSRNGDDSYSLGSNLSDATKTVFVTRLGGALFMTATSLANAEGSDQPNCRYILSGRIELRGDRLTLHSVDVQALAELLGQSEDAPAHHISQGQGTNLILFTGEARPLQSFLARHANAPGLFDGSSTMTFTRVAE